MPFEHTTCRPAASSASPSSTARSPTRTCAANPLSRVTSADGRWAYTLYDGRGMAPFVHALDTVGAEAHCIDLDALAGRNDRFDLRLRLGGSGKLAVLKGPERLAVIDLQTLRVTERGSVPARGSSGGGTPWVPIGAAIAVVTASLSLAVLRRRRTVLGQL